MPTQSILRASEPEGCSLERGNFMGICFDTGTVCIPSLFLSITFAFLAATPFAAARLLVLRMRAHAGLPADEPASPGTLQPA